MECNIDTNITDWNSTTALAKMHYELCCSSSTCLHCKFTSPYYEFSYVHLWKSDCRIMWTHYVGLNWQLRRYWSRSNPLLMRPGNVYRIDQSKKLIRMQKKKKIVLILYLKIHTLQYVHKLSLYIYTVCEMFLTSTGIQKSSKSLCPPCVEIQGCMWVVLEC